MPDKPVAGVRALLQGLIDYAGLFPPASLPLEEALANYAGYRQGGERWMLKHFIIPAGRLAELEAHAALFTAGDPWRFVVLGRGGANAAEFQANLAADLEAVTAFRQAFGEAVRVPALEVRLPAGLFRSPDLTVLTGLLNSAQQLISAAGGLQPFYEMPLEPEAPGWEDGVRALAQVLAVHNRAMSEVEAAGYKLRCGGVTAEAFPEPDQVALAVAQCRDEGVPLKCTAGLHHPLRGYRPEVEAKMHGFLNLYCAAILAAVHHLDQATIERILADEDAGSFSFDEAGLGWQELRAEMAQVERLRREWLPGYGSCSFDEPREDLRGLGLL